MSLLAVGSKDFDKIWFHYMIYKMEKAIAIVGLKYWLKDYLKALRHVSDWLFHCVVYNETPNQIRDNLPGGVYIYICIFVTWFRI